MLFKKCRPLQGELTEEYNQCVKDQENEDAETKRDEENTKSESTTTKAPICSEGSRVPQNQTLL